MKEPTQQYSDTIKSLQSRIQALEDENRLLKERLEEAGVSYADIVSGDAGGVVELYDPDQGARIKKFDVTDKIASDFFMMFCRGRKNVYDLRYTNPKTGKNGYYTQCFNRWDRGCHIQKKDGVRCKDCELRAYKPVTLPLIKAHMNGTDPNGNDVVAIYPMLENNLCQLLVFDFDNHAKGAEQEDYANIDDGWKEEINALRRICKNLDVDAVVERSRSGRGAHLWIFFKEMVPARLARRFGFALLEKGAESVNLKSFKYYDRMIPTQDVLPEGGLGNVIALPLQGMALKSGNSAFIDENWNAYEDQLNVLAGTRRLTRQGIEDYLSLWYSTGFTSEDNGTDAPWDKNSEIEAGSVKGVVRIVLADRIYIDSTGMSNKTKRQLRRMATFSNKQYFQNQAMDMPNYDESRFIYLGSDEGKYIVLPRGLREEILKKFDNAGISYKIEDKRTKGQELNISFRGELRESQIPAVETMLGNETGILHAATAFGKTVVCCDMIARRGISTLILVDRADLMNQWIKRLEEFLDIDEELPEYQTKTGRTRKRKSLIGNLQGAHDTLTGIVDVAMIRSLKKKDGFHPKLKEYAQVYFDECHHAASDSAIEVLQEINAKYVYGVTATPKRGDGKEKINEFLLGPIRYRFTAKDRAEEQNINHLVYPRFTRTVKPHHLSKTPYGNDAYELIRNNDVRDEQIIRDVADCVQAGRTPVVLTKYVDHAKKLSERLKTYADRLILLTGANGTKARRAQVEELNKVDDSDSLILVGTGSLLGEGFDFPRLDTLFMATPVSGENVVEQYVGRLNRDYDGKENVIVYDYVDSHIPKFDKMYSARLKAYKKIGYELCVNLDGEKQKANAIYDIENYAETYWKDLEEANSAVVVSSPRLNNQKVDRIINMLGKRRELGVKVTIVTWHPDAYKYGKDDVRMELMERLRKAGFEIRLVEETCEHYAVIDNEIVWYGSVNLLSKEDAEDNLMRVCSKDIAAELLEMTFGSEAELQEW
ncbi:DEAD/DEAH box helicase family protein [Suilimivivens aceti]|uniref:DEAD/DEAH box helicase family protein n=1 Tax=Suilimivivens aceti TaxID=2981774 RepID=A0ABT2T2D7_9FIRM|nr:DEAD/DEAH box helicase family protein [Suilimivivens aceti]MCU6743934.1 DEAD/DEAH box helicase family protein [Suilimivivens aceti]SCH48107.1 Hef nuclease [uncultured Clostridium sp.]